MRAGGQRTTSMTTALVLLSLLLGYLLFDNSGPTWS